MRYAESEVRRIARIGFESARKRNKKLCSVVDSGSDQRCSRAAGTDRFGRQPR